MRKLTVNRKRSIIESGSKIYLYVQCNEEDCDCKAGDKFFKQFLIQNGKSVEVEIWNEETLVSVASSTMQTDFTVPAGESDFTLLTSPKFSPFAGNPFSIVEIK